MTPLISRAINRGITKLERACDYIISTRIALEREQGRRQTGNPYRMRIDVRVPQSADIIVSRFSKAIKRAPESSPREGNVGGDSEAEEASSLSPEPLQKRNKREESLTALIRRTFDSAHRELRKVVDKQHGEIKTPAQEHMQAVVEKILRKQNYGFLRTVDGQQVYFHKNSVLHRHWENLRAGTTVRYSLELGEKGLQASTVELLDKPGVAEIHNELHDLPQVATPRVKKISGRR